MTKPTEQDRQNYSRAAKESPFFHCPERFLKLGDRVRAKFRIWDQPNIGETWGWVSAEAGELGTVVHVQKGCWPTVRFDDTGCATCVTDFEVERMLSEQDVAESLEVARSLTTVTIKR